MKINDYIVAKDLPEAISLLEREKGGARLITGGTDVIVRAKRGFFRNVTLVDVSKIAALGGVKLLDDGRLFIGATTKLTEIFENPEIQARFHILSEAAGEVGSVQIRNMASLGGNIANASPSADTIPPLLVLGATVLAEGPKGKREIAIEEFFTGPGKTCLDPSEVLAGFRLTSPGPGTGMSYIKHSRRVVMDLATVNCAAKIVVDDSGTILEASVALGAVAPTAVLLPEIAERLQGTKADNLSKTELFDLARGRVSPIEDVRSGIEYREEIIAVLLKKAIEKAYQKALHSS